MYARANRSRIFVLLVLLWLGLVEAASAQVDSYTVSVAGSGPRFQGHVQQFLVLEIFVNGAQNSYAQRNVFSPENVDWSPGWPNGQALGLTTGDYPFQFGYNISNVHTRFGSIMYAHYDAVTHSWGLSPPSAPTGLVKLSSTYNSITLTWSAVGDADTYRLERWNGSSWLSVGTTANTQQVDGGLSASTQYSYRVIAINANGESGPSQSYSASTDPLPPPPSDPSNLSVTGSSYNSVSLSWSASTGSPSYHILRSSGGGQFSEVGSTNGLTFTDNGVSARSSYNYKLFASNSWGDSGYSNTVTVQTASSPPSQPSVNWGGPLQSSVSRLGEIINSGLPALLLLIALLLAQYALIILPRKAARIPRGIQPRVSRGGSSRARRIRYGMFSGINRGVRRGNRK